MKNNSVTPGSKVKPASQTDWKRVISQTDSEVERNAMLDKDAPVLDNAKYHKPGQLDKVEQNQTIE